MKKQSILLSLLCWLFVALSAQAQVATGSEVMIQGFNWESNKNTLGWYNVVKGKAADLKASRFDAIWMPPPHDAASNEGYLPRQLYNLTSKYGNQASLVDMINTLHANNVKVLADIVVNHRVGTTSWGDFTNPTWGCNATAKGDEWTGACGNSDSGDGYSAARDLDHSNGTVQTDITAWMNWLKNTIGFDGWRYDYVRGYWGGYNKIYNNGTAPYFSVGELWDNLDLNNPDPHRQQIVNWIDATGGTSTAFDFTTKGILQQAVQGQLYRLNSNGKAPGVIGWWPAKAVTFIDNHDTGSTQAHWPFPGDKVMQGYAYILTHPGIPMVFWDHYYDWGLYNEIKALVNIRKNNGLKSTSVLDIKAASANLYAAIIDGKVAMKIGSDAWSPGTGWTVAASGTNYAVWTKAATTDTTAPVLTVNPASGTFSAAITVTMSATDNVTTSPAIYYTVDGSNPTTSSAQYSGSFTVSSTSTVKAIAVDAAGNQSAIASRTYTIGTTSGGFTVYFKKPTSWTTARLHYWNAIPVGSLAASTWPGVSMVADGGDWFKFTFTNVTSIDLLFHNNAGTQTADLTRNKTGWYADGKWYDTDPRVGLKIHFKKPTTWAAATLYYWNTAPAGAAAVTWPGVQMVSEGNGWFVFTIPSSSCSSLIFSNNGATQTADLSRCGEGWYANGTWYNSLPAGVRVEYAEQEQSLGLELQNYPNPFSGSTTISFSLPESGEVTLKVYNVFGQEVATLKNEKMESGSHAVDFDASRLSNGMYTYKLQAGKRSITKKMLVNN